ncbi:DsbA family protein [Paraglaciecola aquimarina]|uniref:DsbA family protein n=1 Tax=Paraglaciecola algarum TaxID=3050085 RepID=A0ABS9D9Z3_9ALTE|nr:thioredoxin domain-containing protein [Paraglaciecola sp. G1-23]MCF2948446.1 DsbA family protein [Paraglaciecola sp. G1-23]
MQFSYKILVLAFTLICFNTSVKAQAQSSDIDNLKLQVNSLSQMVEQLRANQIVMARKLGLVKPKELVQGEAVPITGGILEGERQAKVVIMEFTDIQCPYCRKFGLEVFPDLKKKYIDTGKVLFVNRQNPIASHKQAKTASKYLICAAEQNLFSEVKNGLFEEGTLVAKGSFNDIGVIANLDQGKLKQCLANDTLLEQKIAADLELGKRMGVASTPSFFVGLQDESGSLVKWVKVVGAKPIEYFVELLDKMLAS